VCGGGLETRSLVVVQSTGGVPGGSAVKRKFDRVEKRSAFHPAAFAIANNDRSWWKALRFSTLPTAAGWGGITIEVLAVPAESPAHPGFSLPCG
jgi:hypothetical protein